ncbi:MAG: hypothetical protein HOE90_09250 [Bacteriovoracaceae bacterium]|jgi:hypothetical protein|nr:hypothetical protein [Bacteriovoracaceae bacterium]
MKNYIVILTFLLFQSAFSQIVEVDTENLSQSCDELEFSKISYGYENKGKFMEACKDLSEERPNMFLGYKSYLIVEGLLKSTSRNNPTKARLFSIGKTHRKKDIFALQITNFADSTKFRPTVFLNCAHHALELLSTEYCFKIISELLSEENSMYLDQFDFWIVPLVNPDGSENYWHRSKYSGRKNGRMNSESGVWNTKEGVDINRNYPFMWGIEGKYTSSNPESARYMGPTPASEPEIQAVMNLSIKKVFTLSISFHTVATSILVPYTIPEATNPIPELPKQFAQKMAAASKTQRKSKPKYIVRKNIYPVSGTDQDWHYFKNGTMALLVEGPFYHTGISYHYSKVVMDGFMPGFWAYLNHYHDLPKLEVHAIDQEGRALSVQVEVVGRKYYHNEKFFTSSESGRYILLFETSGPHKVLITYTDQHDKKEYRVLEVDLKTKHVVKSVVF